MKIVEIKDSNELQDYLGMDLLDLMERAAIPGYRIFGAVDEGVAAGCVMFSETEAEITIEWIYVLPDSRDQGVADALLDKVREVAERPYRRVGVYIPDLYARECVCPEEDSFISDIFSLSSEEAVGEWCATLEAMGRHPVFLNKAVSGYIKDKCDMVPVAKLKMSDVTSAVSSVSDEAGVAKLYDVAENGRFLDADLSLVSYVRGSDRTEVNGVLMIQRVGSTLYPVFVYGECEIALMGLMRSAVLLAEGSCAPGTQIRFFLRDAYEDHPKKMYDVLDDIFQVKTPGYGRYITARRMWIWEEREFF